MIKNFSVPSPCGESWDGMKPQQNGRYCDSCKKIVVDFTNKTEKEILDYLQANAGKSTCGTFKTTQLHSQQKAIEKQKNEFVLRFVAAILLVFGSSLISCKYEGERLHSIDLGDTVMETDLNDNILTGDVVVNPLTTKSIYGYSIIVDDGKDSTEQNRLSRKKNSY